MQKEIGDLMRYRDLFLVFIWRDFSIRYKQTILGILWAVLQPLSLTVLFTIIFTYVIPGQDSRYPRFIYYFTGLLPWTFFATALNYAIRNLVAHYDLIRKIYFPRLIIPLTGVSVAFVDFMLAGLIFLLVFCIFQIPLTIYAFWSFGLLWLLLCFTISISLIFSALNVYYRDVGLATNFLIQLWFFATPVLYSVEPLPLKWKWVLFLNPLTFIIENFRRCLLEGRPILVWQFGIMLLWAWVALWVGIKFFSVTERKFADVI